MTSISKPPDYYEILQVSPNADIKSIKSSWKRLALARHPDKNTAKNAVAEFQLLHEAYSILIDPSTRQTYDAKYQASTSTSAQYSTSQTSRKTPDKDGEQKSIQELQSMLHRCEKDIRDHELRLKEAHASLMKLRAEITSLENDARSMEQDKASGQTIWGYLTSFLPGGESRLEQEREERDRIYRGKLATRRIKETEKSRRLEKIQAYEVFARAYRQQAISIEKKITEKREKDRRDYEELNPLIRQFAIIEPGGVVSRVVSDVAAA
ncbi:hypothetical protein N7517_010101 [Penicillium concentricum]|uniref:J domain-containing protein n=1 Tax=Penicillium concentricum TaxID=293559 RepID=A0A9W9UZI8_9EURO|nr:uncharacterized protein N7517_010101 [Penicillium concentricum]KAJ5360910.1 hypothetical protein N7517_010101 [Penicillium concentricum]